MEWREGTLFLGVFLIIVVAGYLVANFWEDIPLPILKHEKTSVEPYAEQTQAVLYKEPTNFEGYRICSLVFDNSTDKAIEIIKERESTFVRFCNISEGYSGIQEFLYDSYMIEFVNGSDWEYSAWYIGKGRIKINTWHSDSGALALYLAHEIAHSSTEGQNLPPWLNEGIAEYYAARYFGTHARINKFWFDDFPVWNPLNSTIGENVMGYNHAGYVVRMLVEKYDNNIIKEFLMEINGKIKAEDSVESKNDKVIEALRKVTRDETINLDSVIQRPYKSSPEFQVS